jgi:hypothetical protein
MKLILIAYSLFLLSQQSYAQSYTQSGFIIGKIYSQVTKSTLQNAKIVLKKNNKYYGKTKTDHVGNYWFGELKHGSYSIWVLHDGYCSLEVDQIKLRHDGSIQLDLGLVEQATNTNIEASEDKIYQVYQAPICVDLEETTTAHQDFKNEIHILNEVYNGYEIRIAPKRRPPSPAERNRPTHYHESFKSLEKTTALF